MRLRYLAGPSFASYGVNALAATKMLGAAFLEREYQRRTVDGREVSRADMAAEFAEGLAFGLQAAASFIDPAPALLGHLLHDRSRAWFPPSSFPALLSRPNVSSLFVTLRDVMLFIVHHAFEDEPLDHPRLEVERPSDLKWQMDWRGTDLDAPLAPAQKAALLGEHLLDLVPTGSREMHPACYSAVLRLRPLRACNGRMGHAWAPGNPADGDEEDEEDEDEDADEDDDEGSGSEEDGWDEDGLEGGGSGNEEEDGLDSDRSDSDEDD